MSIKAAMHSGMGSKRKLSRMGKKRKKNHAGLDATFIGRSACLKRLQVSLKDFRRLCILKGIYPREPRGRAPGNKKGQVYYHIKDVKAIAHEPLLDKFREFKSFMKKVRKAAGRNEKDEAARLDAQTPVYTLHHLVRERYPRFIDALSDLDDALALIHLFAALPSVNRIKTKVTNKAKELAASWSAYCAVTSSITKSFVSVKGVYFEANVNIRGQSSTGSPACVRWIVPHSFTQHLPKDVDYRVMLTFFEFYEVLLGFVLYKLYNDIGVRYPFVIPKEKERHASSTIGMYLYTLNRSLRESDGAVSSAVNAAIEESTKDDEKSNETKQKTKPKELKKKVDAALNKLATDESSDEESDDEDDVDISTPLRAALENLAEEQSQSIVSGTNSGVSKNLLGEDAIKRKNLFSKLTFFLSREVPRGYLELICLSYGGQVGWEGDDSPINVKDPSITHHIVDRPKLPSSFDSLPKSREFVQPQWILDCANNEFLLPCSKYAVGSELPPHLSPWVDNEEEGYKPAYAEEIEKIIQGEVTTDIIGEKNEKVNKRQASDEETSASSTDGLDEDNEEVQDEEEEEDDDDESKEENVSKKRKKEEKEAHDLAKLMMSKKASRLYGRMQHGISQKQEHVKVLQRRREKLELEKLDKLQRKREHDIDISVKGRGVDGRTVSRQKVDRLKSERKAVVDAYGDTVGAKKKNKKRRKY